MLRMAKRYGCKYPDVFLAVLFAVLIVSTTGYCSFAYAEDSGGGLEPTQEEVDELTARINATPIKKMAKRKEQSSKVNNAPHIRAHTQLIKEPFL